MAILLRTTRLVLRSFDERDVDGWIAMFTDPDVTRYLDQASRERPRTPETFGENLRIRRQMEAELGYAVLAVELADTGVFIGQCGLRPMSRLVAGDGCEIDLGYHFAPAYWGHGYATEAVRATLAFGFGSAGLTEIMAVTEPENIGSWRVMEKAGMRYAGTASYYGADNLRKYIADVDSWAS
jgi:RimJ/RimL family protein N-acetyltransferase